MTILIQCMLQVGDKIPTVDLFEKTPAGKVNSGELFKDGKHIIFAVPGAFTPGCSKVCEDSVNNLPLANYTSFL